MYTCFILNCTKGNLKICNCCLYISSLLLINLYCTHDIRSEADAGLSMNSHHMAQHLCQTQLLLVWPVPRDNNMAGGWCHCLSSKSHLLQIPWACAEWMHQGAAHLHDYQWGPSQAKVQSVNSIGTVLVMVLLSVDTIVFYRVPCLLSHISYIYVVIVSLWWGQTLHLLQCNTCTLLPPASKIEQVLWQYSCFCSELQSWLLMLLTKWYFWLRITAVKLISAHYTC